jgi:gamma-glutamyltranspeptidase/glutathione hydrolase
MGGVIAAGSADTAAAGAAMFARGGNAVDAAVAAAFASFVAEVGAVHLGGSGLAHVFDPRLGSSVVYDFFSAMPGLGRPARPERLDFERVTIDFGGVTQEFYLGRGSVAVPGNIVGLCQLAADYGRLALPVLLEPAIRLARHGVTLEPFQADTCALLAPLYTHTEAMRAIFAPGGRIVTGGEHLFIPHLAETLEALAAEGPAFARDGHLARALVADQAANGGLITATDLTEYEVRQPGPIRVDYGEYEILLPPPSSSGGVLTAFTLKVMNRLDCASRPHGSAAHLQLLYEVMAATTRARPTWDRALRELPPDRAVAEFLGEEIVSRATDEVKAALAGQRRLPFAEPTGPAATSHLSAVDDEGLAVGLTTTAGESAGYVLPGTGYIPNNMLGEADLHPLGFHTAPAGQRITTMMTPLIVLRKGQVRLVSGSGGSIRIRSAIVQTISNALDYRMKLDEAVNAPRVHLEGEVLQCEAGYDPAAVDALEGMGYPVNRWEKRSIYFGGAHTVARTPDGQLVGAGDNRRGGVSATA